MKRKERVLARRLRKNYGLSIKDIAQKTGAAVSSISRWVRDVKLTKAQIRRLMDKDPALNPSLRRGQKKSRGEESKFHKVVGESLSPAVKGRLAEAAILFRLVLYG